MCQSGKTHWLELWLDSGERPKKDERSGFGPNRVFLPITNLDTSDVRSHAYASSVCFYLLPSSGKIGCQRHRNPCKLSHIVSYSECLVCTQHIHLSVIICLLNFTLRADVSGPVLTEESQVPMGHCFYSVVL